MTLRRRFRRSVSDLLLRVTERITRRHLEEARQALAEVKRSAELARDDALRHLLQTRLLLSRRLWQSMPSVASPPAMTSSDFATDLRRLEQLHPELFQRWRQINLVDNPIEYAQRPSGSCSVGLAQNDRAFAGFIAPYLSGRVLDLGCGPQAIPSYLRGYPTQLVSGVDPLEPFEPHPFQFHRGFGEFLPWGDRTFDVVVNATSLDHSFSLDRVTTEIIRVLRPGGMLLVWEGFVKNSPPYRPSDPNLQPVDKFHLFHFDQPWFEAHFSSAFEVAEKLALDDSSNYFYALRLKE